MYRPRGAAPRLKLILAEARGEPIKKYSPMKYHANDISAAKAVLDRLLAPPVRNEISSIKIVPIELRVI